MTDRDLRPWLRAVAQLLSTRLFELRGGTARLIEATGRDP